MAPCIAPSHPAGLCRPAVLLLVVALGFGCGGDSPSAPTTAPPPAPPAPPPAAPPSVQSVAITGAPAGPLGYVVAETIAVQVTFSEVVTVSGSPRLALGIGEDIRHAVLDGDASTGALVVFRYSVALGDVDEDGISIGADALDVGDGSIQSAAGLAADVSLGQHAITNDGNHPVLGALPPSIQGLAITSAPAGPLGYVVAETIAVQLTFSEVVTVSGSPRLALGIGEDIRHAVLDGDASTGALVVFRYSVALGDVDEDGISIGADALDVGDGSIQSAAGLAADVSLGQHAITNDGNHPVLGALPPSIQGLAITSAPAGPLGYVVAATIAVQLTFSEVVTVSGSPRLALGIGEDIRHAVLDGDASTGALVVFRYSVALGDVDQDGISIGADALDVGDGSIQSAAGLAADVNLGQHAITNDGNHPVLSALPPSIQGLAITTAPLGPRGYTLGETIGIGITFSEQVVVSGSPRLGLEIGDEIRHAAWDADGSAGALVFFRYEVASGDRDENGISIEADALDLGGGSIGSAAGLAADINIGQHAITDDGDHPVLGAPPPSVQSLGIVTAPSNPRGYTAGEAIEVEITFSEEVDVVGSPRLALGIGEDIRHAGLDADASTEALLVFRYEVTLLDRDEDGISIGADALDVGDGSILSSAGVAAELAIGEHAIDNDADHPVLGAPPPSVQRLDIVSRPVDPDGYAVGESIGIGITFSEEVVVSGSPRLGLKIGDETRHAAWDADGSAGALVFFRYEVASGDRDENGISIEANALDLGSGSIRSAAGLAADINIGQHAITDDGNHPVLGAPPPSIQSLGIVTTPFNPRGYIAGEAIEVEITFSEDVDVLGSPRLALGIGEDIRHAGWDADASAGALLIFRYEVTLLDRDEDGISIGADALDIGDGSILSSAGVAAELAIGEHAIDNDADHPVLGAPPPSVQRLDIVSRPVDPDGYAVGESIGVVTLFSEEVIVSGSPGLALEIGEDVRYATWDEERTRGPIVSFRYDVMPEDRDDNGISIPADALSTEHGSIRNADGVDVAPDLGDHAVLDHDAHPVFGSPPAMTCGNQRSLALRHDAQFGRRGMVREWDGTPFRVDMVRNFPDFATDADLQELLDPIGWLADQIEAQLGYRVVEMGDLIDVPAGAPVGWDQDFSRFSQSYRLRERGQILVFYMNDDNPQDWDGRGGSPLSGHPCCGTITFNKRSLGPLWTGDDPCCQGNANRREGEALVHELFHLLGFKHYYDQHELTGIQMSPGGLDAPWRTGSLRFYATWGDIDNLRCAFPEGG